MAAFGGHRGTNKALEKPYRMLLLWEETMAQTVSQFLMNPKYQETKLIVLSGGFHVQYGFGIPKRAFRRVPHSYSIIQPTVTHVPEKLKDREMEVEKVSIPLYAADYAWKVEYKVPDNVRLGVRLEQKKEGIMIAGFTSGAGPWGGGRSFIDGYDLEQNPPERIWRTFLAPPGEGDPESVSYTHLRAHET